MRNAREIMTRDVVQVTENTPVEQVAKIFVEHGFNGLVVVSPAGEVLGVVTNNDLVDQSKKLHIPTVIALFDSVIYLESDKKFKKELEKITASTVKDIYTHNPVTVGPDATVVEMASIMAEKHIHTLPVVEDGKLVGVVGKIDIIRSMIS